MIGARNNVPADRTSVGQHEQYRMFHVKQLTAVDIARRANAPLPQHHGKSGLAGLGSSVAAETETETEAETEAETEGSLESGKLFR